MDKPGEYLTIHFDSKGVSLSGFGLTYQGDFAETMMHRVTNGRLQHEMLVKAASSEKEGRKAIDATAGMGEDAFLLAAQGYEVTLYEQNPVEGSHHLRSSDDTELFVMGFSGILLIILGIVLAAVNYISLSQNIAAKHEEIMMIMIAAYTFCKIAMTVVKAVKQHKNPSPLLRTIRNISYAEVSASVLTLQRSMLVSFGSVDRGQIRMMNAATGAAVCLFVLMLGLSMITKSNRERNLNNGKIQTCKNQ